MIVFLTTDYEVELASEDGFEHLFNAVVGEVLTYHRSDTRSTDWNEILHGCACELHFVAGQLRHARSAISLGLLMDEFSAHWDMLRGKLTDEGQMPI